MPQENSSPEYFSIVRLARCSLLRRSKQTAAWNLDGDVKEKSGWIRSERIPAREAPKFLLTADRAIHVTANVTLAAIAEFLHMRLGGGVELPPLSSNLPAIHQSGP